MLNHHGLLSTKELVLLLHGRETPHLIKGYQALRDELESKVGQLTVLHYPDRVRRRYIHRVGLLSGNGLVREEPPVLKQTPALWFIPTAWYVEIEFGAAEEKPILKLEPTRKHMWSYEKGQGAPPRLQEIMDRRLDWHNSIVIGDAAVREYMAHFNHGVHAGAIEEALRAPATA